MLMAGSWGVSLGQRLRREWVRAHKKVGTGFADGLGDTCGHQYGSATQDNDLIGVKDCIAVFIKNDQFVAVFLVDLLTKLVYAGLVSGLLKSILLVHPRLEGGGKGYRDNG